MYGHQDLVFVRPIALQIYIRIGECEGKKPIFQWVEVSIIRSMKDPIISIVRSSPI